jgi:hypothetical protein
MSINERAVARKAAGINKANSLYITLNVFLPHAT